QAPGPGTPPAWRRPRSDSRLRSPIREAPTLHRSTSTARAPPSSSGCPASVRSSPHASSPTGTPSAASAAWTSSTVFAASARRSWSASGHIFPSDLDALRRRGYYFRTFPFSPLPGQLDPDSMASTATPVDRLGDLLVRNGLITQEQLAKAVADARANGTSIRYSLVKLGFIEEHDLVRAIARLYRVPAVDLEQVVIDPRVIRLVPADIALKHGILPLRRIGRTLTVAMADPTDAGALDDLKFITRHDIEPVIAGEFTLRKHLEKHYGSSDERLQEILEEIEAEDIEVIESDDEEVSLAALQAQIEEAPVVKLINGILTDAVTRGASDIHIEPYEKELRVRYRIDGVLHEIMKPPLKMKAALTSRIKILSDLNIAERRVPQDGRIKLKLKNKVIDFRVSTLPVIFGEKIVLRILDKGNLSLELEKFGMEPKAERDFMSAIMNPYGMVLVTGPTGSGKTTTLYSALSKVNTTEVNIMTSEDPVEYNLHGI